MFENEKKMTEDHCRRTIWGENKHSVTIFFKSKTPCWNCDLGCNRCSVSMRVCFATIFQRSFSLHVRTIQFRNPLFFAYYCDGFENIYAPLTLFIRAWWNVPGAEIQGLIACGQLHGKKFTNTRKIPQIPHFTKASYDIPLVSTEDCQFVILPNVLETLFLPACGEIFAINQRTRTKTTRYAACDPCLKNLLRRFCAAWKGASFERLCLDVDITSVSKKSNFAIQGQNFVSLWNPPSRLLHCARYRGFENLSAWPQKLDFPFLFCLKMCFAVPVNTHPVNTVLPEMYGSHCGRCIYRIPPPPYE